MIVHTFSAYPEALTALNDCLRLASPGDVLFCRDDSVYALRLAEKSPLKSAAESGVSFSALQPDLDIRGLTPDILISGVECCDHQSFVALCARADKIIHWG